MSTPKNPRLFELCPGDSYDISITLDISQSIG
jgi:hypothetical protein